MVVHKTVFRPVLVYGSESWVLTSRLKSMTQAVEINCLRRVEGVTRLDRGRGKLKIELSLKTVEDTQLMWFGQMCRKNLTSQVAAIWENQA